MTGDELDRTINFLLNSQANLDSRIERTNEQLARTNEQVAQTNEQLARTNEQLSRTNGQLSRTNGQLEQLSRHLDSFSDTQAGIMQVMIRTYEAQAEFNKSFSARMDELAAAQARTEEALTHLTIKVDKLADIVEGGRGVQ